MTAFALISDLHSNLAALRAVFDRIDELGIEEVNCLGDIVGYCAEPEPCVRLVMERCKWTLIWPGSQSIRVRQVAHRASSRSI